MASAGSTGTLVACVVSRSGDRAGKCVRLCQAAGLIAFSVVSGESVLSDRKGYVAPTM